MHHGCALRFEERRVQAAMPEEGTLQIYSHTDIAADGLFLHLRATDYYGGAASKATNR
jgi:hypothetical protein